MNDSFIIKGLNIYTEQEVLRQASILVKDGVIKSINTTTLSDETNRKILEFPQSYHLIPGMIDLHMHGLMGMDIMDATPEALHIITTHLPKEGTTAFLATTMTESPDNITRALKNVRDWQRHPNKPIGAEILGIHLEGPFLAEKRMNAQPETFRLAPNIALFQKWQQLATDMIRMVTLAPEVPGALELIRYLHQNGVIPAAGHSDATYAEAVAAIAEGCTYATHLFNAMRSIHHREPGLITALLLADSVTAELIADGVHLHPAIMQLAMKLKGFEKLILVTDAMRAKCLGEGTYELAGQQVTVIQNEARLANGTLAGSVLSMHQALKNMMRFTNSSLEEILPLVTENPAKLLDVFERKGSITIGKEADLVVLDEKFQVVLTLCKGYEV